MSSSIWRRFPIYHIKLTCIISTRKYVLRTKSIKISLRHFASKSSHPIHRLKPGHNIAIEQAKSSVPAAVNRMIKGNIGCLVVVDDNNKNEMVGVVTKRDCLQAISSSYNNLNECILRDIMTPNHKIITANNNISSAEYFQIMKTHNIDHLPLLDNDDFTICKVLSINDIALSIVNKTDTNITTDHHEPDNKNAIFEKACADHRLNGICSEMETLTSPSDLLKVSLLINEMKTSLANIHDESGDILWNEFVEYIQTNKTEMLSVFYEDPFALRIYTRPRGYMGDPVLMDWIYNRKHNVPNVSVLGNNLFQSTMKQFVEASGVPQRAHKIGSYIDKLYANRHNKLSVFSIACGHCREINHSLEFWKGNVNLFAFDQDKKSLKTLEDHCKLKGYNISVINGKLFQLFKKKYCQQKILKLNNGEKFDFIWSAGLFDYLSEKSARKLTKYIFENLLKPNGTILIANWLRSDALSAPYMELIGNWKLIYRTLEQMQDIANDIDDNYIQSIKTSNCNSMGYLEIVKKN
eukprot:318964_1